MDVAEFFILRGFRREGIGRAAFRQITRMFPGPWVVKVLDEYEDALEFWERVIQEVVEGEIKKEWKHDGERAWIVFRFDVSEPVNPNLSN